MNGPAELDFACRRRLGLEQSLQAHGLRLSPDLVSSTLMTDANGFQHMARFLEREDRPTAVLCASTVLALGAVRAIRQAGLDVGKDISVIAHDDDLLLLKPEHFSTPLTTTRSPIREAGRRVAERLIAAVKGEDIGAPEREIWRANSSYAPQQPSAGLKPGRFATERTISGNDRIGHQHGNGHGTNATGNRGNCAGHFGAFIKGHIATRRVAPSPFSVHQCD